MSTSTAVRCPACGTPARAAARFCRSCGAALTPGTQPSPPVDDSTEPPPPRRRRRVRARWIVLAIAVVVLAATGAVVWTANEVVYPPQDPVREFFAALAARDNTTAVRLAGGGTGSPLAAGGAFAQGYTPPSDVQLGEVTYGKATDETRRSNRALASVAVTYRLGDQLVHASVSVQRATGGPVRPWSLAGSVWSPVAVVNRYGGKAAIAGISVATVADRPAGSDGTVRLLPGVYTVTLADDPLLSATPASVAVGGSATTTVVQLDIVPNPAAQAEVDKVIRARIDECAQATRFDPPGCPFAYWKPIYRPGAQFHWRVATYPQFTLRLSESPAADGGPLIVKTTRPGVAVVEYTTNGQQAQAEVEFDVDGAVFLDGIGIAWTG